MAKNKKVKQRKRLAALFASFSILIMGTASLLESMSFDYYSVLNTLQKVIPASIIIGALGWVMGMILDRPKRKGRLNLHNSFLKQVMPKEIVSENSIIVEDLPS